MKKKILYVLSFIALALAVLLVVNIRRQYQQKLTVMVQKKRLPAFSLYNQKMQRFSSSQLNKHQPVCIYYYNAECEHCQYQAGQISKHINRFDGIQLLMISTNRPDETNRFMNTYRLAACSSITWLYDKHNVFYKYFGHPVCPSTYIYNAKHQLQREYLGEVKLNVIINQLHHAKES